MTAAPMSGRARLLAACARQPVDATPAWFMRQAGGSLPGYLALRERHSVIEIARDPELCAEVSAGAAEMLGTDGAVLFADVMLVAEAMGIRLELTPEGPVLERPITSLDDVDALREVDPVTDLGFVLEAIGRIRTRLGDRAAVIGLAGGPYTMAAYLLEGGPSKDRLRARTVMHGDPELWAALLGRLATATSAYVTAQAVAGADVIQLFDSWAGDLSMADYDRAVAPHATRILDAIEATGVPAVHFAARGASILPALARAGGDVISVDETQSLSAAWGQIPGRAVQGNLDPARLLAGWPATAEGARAVLAEAAGRPGHVFNLGHATPRSTPTERLRDLVTLVHEESAGRLAASTGEPRP
jgi:uroporphyrinogen decarboxylase